jgi:hypothetical protein
VVGVRCGVVGCVGKGGNRVAEVLVDEGRNGTQSLLGLARRWASLLSTPSCGCGGSEGADIGQEQLNAVGMATAGAKERKVSTMFAEEARPNGKTFPRETPNMQQIASKGTQKGKACLKKPLSSTVGLTCMQQIASEGTQQP